MGVMQQARREDEQAVFHEWFVDQQTDLEQYSIFYRVTNERNEAIEHYK